MKPAKATEPHRVTALLRLKDEAKPLRTPFRVARTKDSNCGQTQGPSEVTRP